MHLLNVQLRWMTFMRILMITTQTEKEKLSLCLMTWLQTLWVRKSLKPWIKELFFRCRKLNLSLVFITQSYFSVPKNFRLNSIHYLIMKINNRKELQKSAINHTADIDYKDFVKICRECTKKLFNFLTNDTTLSASDPLKFRKKIFSFCKDNSNWSA